MRNPRRLTACSLGLSVLGLVVGCSSTGTGVGDENSAGYPLASGGTTSSGGSGSETGGTSPLGGASAAGGVSAGGTPATGGLETTGGTGSQLTGGASATGGAETTGGTSATDGGRGTGGTSAPGGALTSGGTSVAGGTFTSGGTSVAGGTFTSGGTSAPGGAAASGGIDAAGGADATGGGGSGETVDTEGCPLTLEGFAKLEADGQNGTFGGRDGETVTVSTQAELDTYATAEQPYTIRVAGPITISPKGTEIRVASSKTIVGVGTTGAILEGGFFLATGVHNVILRNLTIANTFVAGDWEGKSQDFDGVQMDAAHHVWIDHCEFHHIGDGIIDSRKDTTYLTVSWNILRDHNKAFGIGWTDNLTAQMTIHHNILRDTNQRNPSIDNVLRAHLYDNWLLRVESYGNYARGGTNLVLENSVFDQVNDPHYYDTGSLVAIGNIYRSTTGQTESSGETYSSFDPHDYYDYQLDPASEVEALLTKCAGPRDDLGQ